MYHNQGKYQTVTKNRRAELGILNVLVGEYQNSESLKNELCRRSKAECNKIYLISK